MFTYCILTGGARPSKIRDQNVELSLSEEKHRWIASFHRKARDIKKIHRTAAPRFIKNKFREDEEDERRGQGIREQRFCFVILKHFM